MKEMKRSYAFSILGFAAIGIILGTTGGQSRCYTEEVKTVRGSSLSGLVEPGTQITAAMGYYACNNIQRGDIVLYHFGGSTEPLIKIVKAIPGDEWSLRPIDPRGRLPAGQAGEDDKEIEENISHIIVNNRVLENSLGEPYRVNAKEAKLLSLYLRDYGGVIQKSAYLILGNTVSGSTDSRRFGLVSSRDILGKVLK
ncbi:MAG: hypothetical protein COU11_00730 [Candidatus Harrisonbacteria bacterium CG10_big_fil_rev_8_21_14_0_10_49_15]|uniref:Peptidase S26 domain-containing protein n=1 Tax=Candidatus Harrisonbacteria bacterium CG10_big_fil_rev_8_21_14_0_10_49_15 TaxID=1974587 RepID=A0A2H0ULT3_9BACT|nr:MAG: hypothetical protein COU11_00730 [Candidatus Harrisonbacteria bacterium CG10_big_fil_rev_8_21_14_0_10_49_15]